MRVLRVYDWHKRKVTIVITRSRRAALIDPSHHLTVTHLRYFAFKGGIIIAGVVGAQRRRLGDNADTPLRLALDDDAAPVIGRRCLRLIAGQRRHIDGQRCGSSRAAWHAGCRRGGVCAGHCCCRAGLIAAIRMGRHRLVALQD